MGFFILYQPFWDTPILGNYHILLCHWYTLYTLGAGPGVEQHALEGDQALPIGGVPDTKLDSNQSTLNLAIQWLRGSQGAIEFPNHLIVRGWESQDFLNVASQDNADGPTLVFQQNLCTSFQAMVGFFFMVLTNASTGALCSNRAEQCPLGQSCC